ncbi:unnamed protein product [Eruca vesicaria subsp. sativa]|uniref:PPM-type phosphatase domain-containing protein n=1 Tax=Eruca vesicaria subsp. sativa TaxID=29727 RepID=A0ABC8JZV9_ERUVS|nr:unnamed protein product [Eruca vesicaria subsp. sativa]
MSKLKSLKVEAIVLSLLHPHHGPCFMFLDFSVSSILFHSLLDPEMLKLSLNSNRITSSSFLYGLNSFISWSLLFHRINLLRDLEFAAKNLCNNILGEVVNVSESNESEIEEAVKRGYLATDSDFLKKIDVKGGSCCVTALIKDGNLVVSNAGDCRAVLSVGGFAEALTSDHRPSREDERNRVESLGGYVDTFNSVCRIQGSLAVSRGIGDAHLKRWVISEPETKILRINPQHEFLILASDGLWEKVGNQEAVDIARPFCMGTDDQKQKPFCLTGLLGRYQCDVDSVMPLPLTSEDMSY